MRVVKSQILLYMYDELINERIITQAEIINMFGIRKRTFFNYINEIKAFLLNMYKPCELIYDINSKGYVLKK